jgi:ribonuclease H2 subunit A
VVVEKKADATYPIVSAASICAKVPRDLMLHNWQFEDPSMCNDRQWGCGYPSDEQTKRWMRDNLQPVFGWPDLVRFSWGPVKDVLDKEPAAHGAHVVLWADDDEAGEAAVEQQRNASRAGDYAIDRGALGSTRLAARRARTTRRMKNIEQCTTHNGLRHTC